MLHNQLIPTFDGSIDRSLSPTQGLLVHSGSERKRQERMGLQRDTEDLEQGGKWLSESCRLILTKRVEAYFKAPDRLEGGSGQPITIRDAMEFQAHLLLHLLNDNVIPVPRSEIFCKLQIGVSFTWDSMKKIYVIEVSSSDQLIHRDDQLIMSVSIFSDIVVIVSWYYSGANQNANSVTYQYTTGRDSHIWCLD